MVPWGHGLLAKHWPLNRLLDSMVPLAGKHCQYDGTNLAACREVFPRIHYSDCLHVQIIAWIFNVERGESQQ